MRRYAATLMALTLAVTAWASDPWNSKPYEKWSRKDVERILHNSPWAQGVRVPYDPLYSRGGPGVTVGTRTRIGNVPYDPTDDPASREPDESYVVRWNSALTVRRALYRDAILRGAPQEEARQYLRQHPEEFELVLIPAGGTLLPEAEPSTLMRGTSLTLQPSGESLTPMRAQARRRVDASRVEGYGFQFRRLRADGSPAIPANVTQIDFFLQLGPRQFRARFQVNRMLLKEDPDLY